MEAWWTRTSSATDTQSQLSAVAYYRHSAEIGQENSVEIQQDNVQTFAAGVVLLVPQPPEDLHGRVPLLGCKGRSKTVARGGAKA